MPKTLDEVLAGLPQEQQEDIERRADNLIRRISLAELRRSLGISQKQLAEALKVSQAAVSKQERRQENSGRHPLRDRRSDGGEP
jgi:DNA-binding transcriptional regulator YiaG